MREYFMKTERLGFSVCEKDDLEFAKLLWGEPEVTRFICALGVFSGEDIKKRLETEMRTRESFGVQ